ncbi:ketoacyl-ACP synthase III [Streptomyces sp. NPDC004539]|uniref:3-oxoacyl-ACP synthase III family protein n=1 Tax=Streptomyces sp. NPDC004539 TaxID=3154280 RepID=UPI0033B29A79
MTCIGILGTGSYLPKEEITNEEIARRVPNITAEWIGRRTLIQGRRYAAPHEATSDLAHNAGSAALKAAGLTADRVDYLIVATSTGDAPLPPTSSLVQNTLGADRAACFDINIACAGFVFALDIARGLVAQRPGSHALVIGADLYSRFLDYEDRGTAVLLGDAAGAAVIGEVADGYGILGTELVGRGDAHELIWIEGGGSRTPASRATVDGGGHYLRMKGRGVADFVMANVPPLVGQILERAGAGHADVDHFVPHQANGVLLGELVERCGLTASRTHTPLVTYGNMGAASVAVALDEAVRDGLVQRGELLLLAGFGAGMAAGLCLLRWSA